MVWPCVYNIDKLEDKPMRLQVGAYDFDVGKDDLIGEGAIDLKPVLKAAFQHRERNRFLQCGQPFRIIEGAAKGFQLTFELIKDDVKMGEVVLSIEVVDKMVALLKPAAEAREEPNNHPSLPEPLRKMPWDENPTINTYGGGCCGGGGGDGGGNMQS